jgi:hypothetical protein
VWRSIIIINTMTTTTEIPRVPVSQEDFLEQDPPLRGQNFACLSFVSPEEVLADKEAWMFGQFTQHFGSDVREMLAGLAAKYPDDAEALKGVRDRYPHLFDEGRAIEDEYKSYKRLNEADLESRFHAANKFRTSIRGIKVRGVFDSFKEAEVRAQVLKRLDGRFDVFVAQVGCWCPWSPAPEAIEDQQYAETELNTLMSEYRKNQERRDEFFAQRKDELKARPQPTTSDGGASSSTEQ